MVKLGKVVLEWEAVEGTGTVIGLDITTEMVTELLRYICFLLMYRSEQEGHLARSKIL